MVKVQFKNLTGFPQGWELDFEGKPLHIKNIVIRGDNRHSVEATCEIDMLSLSTLAETCIVITDPSTGVIREVEKIIYKDGGTWEHPE